MSAQGEFRTMATGRLLRLLGSRNYRRKHDADAREYAAIPAVDYTDDMDASIVDDVAGELEDRINNAVDTARRALMGPRP